MPIHLPKHRRFAIFAIACLATADRAIADALVVTRAMKASTIAEIFIEESEIRVELEVGAEDIEAFQNLLPDEMFEKVTRKADSWEERLRMFLDKDWRVLVGDQQLAGSMEKIKLTKRVIRDEITGQPLPNQPEDAEIVIWAELRYPLETRPQSISIHPPVASNDFTQANIGFVAYHNGVAVNDFRYLSREETLRLDWSDPWYSAFDRKTLRRRYFAPAAAFLYVENFEVRKEIVFRPKDLQQWVDLGLAGKSMIEASLRDAICEKAAHFLEEHSPVEIDGQRLEGTLDRVHFIERSLKTAGVVDPGEDIDIDTAMIGAIYVYPTRSLPEKVAMEWDLFNERISQIPTVATDEAGGMPGYLDRDDPILLWQNFLKNPTLPAFLEVTPPAKPNVLPISLITLLCIAGIVVVWLPRIRHVDSDSRTSTRSLSLTILLSGVAVGTSYWPRFRVDVPLGPAPTIASEEAGDVTYSLLHNVYRAFDYRDENTIYDVLERSASGDLLTKIFLETRQSLTLASQGGARVKVKEVELVSCASQPAENDAFVASCRWNVTGSVGHWGHIHQRKNQYNGEFTVQVVEGQWKLTEMELLGEERL